MKDEKWDEKVFLREAFGYWPLAFEKNKLRKLSL